MSESEAKRGRVAAVEALILEKFRTEPFHNLYLLYGYARTTLAYGGTCSDKTLSFYQSLKRLGVTATLHTAFIAGAEIHRLVKVEIGSECFFADVGNGWPSIKTFPFEREIEYSCFGMTFRSAIQGRQMSIYNTRNGVERKQMDILFDGKSEDEILADIEARFKRGIEYPFSHGIRFSQVVGDRFLFLRDNRLEIHCDTNPYNQIDELDTAKTAETIKKYFNFDVDVLGPVDATSSGKANPEKDISS